MSRPVHVIGVGMTQFTKPGASEDYSVMGAKAIADALKDAGIDYREVQQAFAGYVYGDSCCGHKVVYSAGLTGIPIFNFNSNCSTGSSALAVARQAIAYGAIECALVVGFEQMTAGALKSYFGDRSSPGERHGATMARLQGVDMNAPGAAQMFGGAGREHMKKYGTKAETLAKISVKARKHAANNPLALFNTPLSLEEIMAAPMVFEPLTRYQCCPPTCGAGAAVLCSPEFAARHGLGNLVTIKAQAVTTDTESSFGDSMMKMVGYDMARSAAQQVYQASGVDPQDIDVVELHDCFTANELISYEALGLCPEGGAEKLIEDNDNTYGGRFVVNPSGGLLSKGHPLGATGLAQCYELVQQLRGRADRRQVEGARLALQHNLGIGGTCVVTLYERG